MGTFILLLAGIAVLLFAIGEAHNGKAPKPSQENAATEAISTDVTESGAIGSWLSSITEIPLPESASLGNDQDHDGDYDGIVDALTVLCGFVVLRVRVVLLEPLVGRLLLRFCQPPILFSFDYYLALERPG